LAALTRDRPGVEIEVDEGELDVLLPRLIAGELDLALAYRYDAVPVSWPAALSETELLRESLWVLIPDGHRLASSHTVGLGSLRAARWVAPLAGSPGAVNLDRLAATAGFTPRVSFRSNDYSVVRGLVAAGLGVALVPGLALRDEPGVLARPLGSGAGRGRSRRGREVVALHRRTTGNALVSAALAAMTHPSGTHPSGIVRPDVSAAPGVS
jgi:DNA-binding transcriptional LysR family regulator